MRDLTRPGTVMCVSTELVCPSLEGGPARSALQSELSCAALMSPCQADKLNVGCSYKNCREVNELFSQRVEADLRAERMQCSEEQLDNLGT